MQKKLVTLLLILVVLLSSCERKCKNCNAEGTPFPTLAPEEWAQ